MARIATALAVLGAAGLAACSTYDPYYSSTPNPNPPTAAVTPAPVAVVPAVPVAVVPAAPVVAYRTGMGTVESVSLVNVPPAATASTGASSPTYPAYRLSIRMDDGSVQTIDQDNRAVMVGDRVEVTSAGRVLRR